LDIYTLSLNVKCEYSFFTDKIKEKIHSLGGTPGECESATLFCKTLYWFPIFVCQLKRPPEYSLLILTLHHSLHEGHWIPLLKLQLWDTTNLNFENQNIQTEQMEIDPKKKVNSVKFSKIYYWEFW